MPPRCPVNRPVFRFVCAAIACAPAAASACWAAAADRYGIPVELLQAVAQVESGLRPAAINRSHLQRTGSYDIGLMQVNSGHLRTLARYGITEAQLREPCTNVMVGAWLLAGQFARYGWSWEALGSYNAACTELKGADCVAARSAYAWRVYRHLQKHRAGNAPTAIVPPRSMRARSVGAERLASQHGGVGRP